MTSSETWHHPLVEDEVANWSPDDLGRSSDDGKDPIPLLVTDKSNPSVYPNATTYLYWSFYSKILRDINLSTKARVHNYKLIAQLYYIYSSV